MLKSVFKLLLLLSLLHPNALLAQELKVFSIPPAQKTNRPDDVFYSSYPQTESDKYYKQLGKMSFTGIIVEGPMGGATYFIQTSPTVHYPIIKKWTESEEIDAKFDRLVTKGTRVAVTGFTVASCKEFDVKKAECTLFDRSQPITVQET